LNEKQINKQREIIGMRNILRLPKPASVVKVTILLPSND
jgi:hypothetical protein